VPSKPLRPCSQPGCPAIAASGGRCQAHQRESRRRYEVGRESASQRGYDVGWRRNRGRFLKYVGKVCMLCGHECGAPGDEPHVDHIVPRSQGGTDEWSNLQVLCKRCHNSKTATVDGGGASNW
jgi:5-methylcytosine-specific restriction enzyme A